MSYLNKEQLPSRDQSTVDEIALKEVESYIEKVEGSTERTVSDNNNQTQPVVTQPTNQNIQASASNKVLSGRQEKKILLPIDENFMNTGLRNKPSTGVRWLAEWCLMMIKKYPGRVFYSPTNTYD